MFRIVGTKTVNISKPSFNFNFLFYFLENHVRIDRYEIRTTTRQDWPKWFSRCGEFWILEWIIVHIRLQDFKVGIVILSFASFLFFYRKFCISIIIQSWNYSYKLLFTYHICIHVCVYMYLLGCFHFIYKHHGLKRYLSLIRGDRDLRFTVGPPKVGLGFHIIKIKTNLD